MGETVGLGTRGRMECDSWRIHRDVYHAPQQGRREEGAGNFISGLGWPCEKGKGPHREIEDTDIQLGAHGPSAIGHAPGNLPGRLHHVSDSCFRGQVL